MAAPGAPGRGGRRSGPCAWLSLPCLAVALLLATAAPAAEPSAPPPSEGAAPSDGYDLEALKALALTDNPDLLAAMERVRAARSRLLEAQAAYYPTLDYSGRASRNHDFGDGTGDERTFSRYRHGPSASWVVFDGFLRQFETQSQRQLTLAQEAREQDVRRVLAASVASGFYLAMQASDRRRIAREAAAVNSALLDVCRRQLAAGVAMEVDCLNFQVRLNNAHLEGAGADLSFAAAAAALRALLGPHAPPGEPYRFPAGEPIGEATPLDPAAALAAALESRPDLRSAANRVAAAEAAVKANQAASWPTVTVNGELQYDDPGAFSVDTERQTWLVGASLSWALFDGGKRSSRVQGARAEAAAALHELEALRRSVAREIEESQAAVGILLRSLALSRDTVALSRRIRDLTRQRYEMGLESIARLNQSLGDLDEAERTHSDTRAALAMSLEDLDAAIGRNLPARP